MLLGMAVVFHKTAKQMEAVVSGAGERKRNNSIVTLVSRMWHSGSVTAVPGNSCSAALLYFIFVF